jgi:hypothetical protein
MVKLFAIVLIVAAIWIGLTVYTEGADRAFGGLFAGSSSSPAVQAPAAPSIPRRAGDAVQRAYDESEDRVDRVLDGTR